MFSLICFCLIWIILNVNHIYYMRDVALILVFLGFYLSGVFYNETFRFSKKQQIMIIT